LGSWLCGFGWQPVSIVPARNIEIQSMDAVNGVFDVTTGKVTGNFKAILLRGVRCDGRKNGIRIPWEGQGPSGPGVGNNFEGTTHPVWLRDRCRSASHPSQEGILRRVAR